MTDDQPRRVSMIPPVVKTCEICGGPMVPAPIGSLNLACIGCGRVVYGETNYDLRDMA